MKLHDEIDFTTLGWVKQELDETLKQARQALEAFVEDPEDLSQMRFCSTYLHQVQGTLRMVELYGCAKVVDEMEALATGLLKEDIARSETAYDVLMRGIVQLPGYLDRLQSGHRDIPVVLLPLLNDLRGAQGKKLLSESAMFTPHIDAPLPASVAGPARPIDTITFQAAAQKLRRAFEAGLLHWFKADNPGETLIKMRAICDKLTELTSNVAARRVWWISAGVLDALSAGAIESSTTVQMMFGKVSQELKRLAAEGEAVFQSPEEQEKLTELAQGLLYYVAHVTQDLERVNQLKDIYLIDKSKIDDSEVEHARSSLAGHDRELLDTVAEALKEDLMKVKEALDMKLRQGDMSHEGYGDHLETLSRAGNAMDMLNLAGPKQVVLDQHKILKDISQATRDPDEQTLLDVAGSLLYVEALLEDNTQQLGPVEEEFDETAIPRSEVRKILDSLIKEATDNLQEIKQSIVDFIEAPWDHQRVSETPAQLDEIEGALRMLDLDEAGSLLSGIRGYISSELLEKQTVPNSKELEALADAVASLEYYVEAVGEQRPGRDKILAVGMEALGKLDFSPEAPTAETVDDALGDLGLQEQTEALDQIVDEAAAEPAVTPETEEQVIESDADLSAAGAVVEAGLAAAAESPEALPDEEPVDDLQLASDTEVEHAETVELAGTEIPEPAVEQSTESAPAEAEFADHIDDEIREIFIEEVEEELGNLQQLYPQWKANTEDVDSLTTIRRIFHTLKGSGRLVGAFTIGDFSWSIENMLNRVLDNSRAASPAVVGLMDHAVGALPGLLAHVKGEGLPDADIEGIKDVAERLANGEEAELSVAAASPAAEAEPTETAVSESPVVEAEEATPESTAELLDEVSDSLDEASLSLSDVDAEPSAAESEIESTPISADESVVDDLDALGDLELDSVAPLELADEAASEAIDDIEIEPELTVDIVAEEPVDDAVELPSLDLDEAVSELAADDGSEDELVLESEPEPVSAVLEDSTDILEIDLGEELTLATDDDSTDVELGLDLDELPELDSAIDVDAIDVDESLEELPSTAELPVEEVAADSAEPEAAGAADTEYVTELDDNFALDLSTLDSIEAEFAESSPSPTTGEETDADSIDFGLVAGAAGLAAGAAGLVVSSEEAHPEELSESISESDESGGLSSLQQIETSAEELQAFTLPEETSSRRIDGDTPAWRKAMDEAKPAAAVQLQQVETSAAEPTDAVDEHSGRDTGVDVAAEAMEGLAAIDPDLYTILRAEVAGHLSILREYQGQARSEQPRPIASDQLLRAAHTMNGAIAMADVPALTGVTGPLEGYIKRLCLDQQAPTDDGLAAIEQATDQVESIIEGMASPEFAMPDTEPLSLALQALRDQLPDKTLSEHYAVADDDVEVARLAEEREALERLEQERLEQERLEQERLEQERLEQERLEQERLEQERLEQERLEQERLEQERLEQERLEQERLEQERAEQERAEQERAEQERAEQARLEQERAQQEQETQAAELAATATALAAISTEEDYVELASLGDIDDELMEIFLEEGAEILDTADRTMAKWREAPEDHDSVTELQRELHTLKGGARMAGLAPIGDLSHSMESLFEAIVEDKVKVSNPVFETLEQSFDRLHNMLDRVSSKQSVPTGKALVERLDLLLSGGELPEAGQQQEVVDAAIDPATETEAVAPSPVPARETALDQEVAERGAIRPQQELIRVRATLLDNLVNNAGEVSIYRSRLEQQVGTFRFNLEELDQTVTRVRDQLRQLEIETEAQILSRFQREAEELAAEETFDPLEMDRFSTIQQLSRALAESLSDLSSIGGMLDELTRESETLLLQQSRVASDLQEGLMRTRMVPFDSLVPRLRRIVRQTASELSKKAQLKVLGSHGEIDRTVLERVTAPLEHMLRNAVAHGLEGPDKRQQLGKDVEGQITLAIAREATEVVLTVSDDGAGIDHERVRVKAIERGLLKPDADLTERDLAGFILHSGFSTADEVSKIAGRGVGMDVVHNEIKQLGGSLEIDSERGKGTEFTVRLPFTLSVTNAIMVRVGDTTFCIPLTTIEGVVRMRRNEFFKQMEAGETYEYTGLDYQLLELSTLLGLPRSPQDENMMVPVLMTRVGDQRAALLVDTVIGSREIVVKSVGPQVSGVPGIFGATILGDGSIIMILDIGPLVRRSAALQVSAEEAGLAIEEAEAKADRKPLIAVVDDSITMRKVTSRVLERNEMDVMTAKDGVDAVEQLQERIPDLMLLDIEMPRMDGYELATHIRNDVRLRHIPIIMITSRTGAKHRERAMEIGVNRYLGKPYQEADLLRNVNELLEEQVDAV